MPTRPCWVEIRTRALEENFRFLSGLAAPHAELLAILKANAYGHSLALCAPAVERAGAKWLGVTTVEEGIVARALCPDATVLVLAGIFSGQALPQSTTGSPPLHGSPGSSMNCNSPPVPPSAQPGSFPVHLEIDTGMSRQGAEPGELGPHLLRTLVPGPPSGLRAS